MPIDPRQPFETTTVGRTFDKIAQHGRRVEQLERAGSRPTVGSGAPDAALAATLPEGTPYIDRDGLRVYYVLAGVWRSHPLT